MKVAYSTGPTAKREGELDFLEVELHNDAFQTTKFRSSLPIAEMIYLDNNATSQIAPEVTARMLEVLGMGLANPSSQHSAGRLARQILEEARENLLSRLGCRTQGMRSDTLVFTSGGTEANNLAIFGIAENARGRVLLSAIEHPSVLETAARLRTLGVPVELIPVGSDGQISIEDLETMFRSETQPPVYLVSVMGANNETGVLQPINEVSQLCRSYGALLHCDAVQVLGKNPVQFEQWDIDAMTVSAHKLHGPIGVGALIIRDHVKIAPQHFGGFQQLGVRPGTESPLLADAFSAAAELAHATQSSYDMTERLRDQLESGILSHIEDAVVIGQSSPRLPHTSSLSFRGVDRQALQVALDMRGVACSTGSACASGSSQPSHVLQAMGLDEQLVKGGIRLSLSRYTTADEVERAIEILLEVIPGLRKESSRSSFKLS